MFLKLNPIISLETINYQGSYSNFSKELISFFQTFITLRDKSTESQDIVMKKIRTLFLSRENKDKFKNIIKKHTGIEYNIKFGKDSYSCFFATYIPINKNIAYDLTFKIENKKDNVDFEKRLDKFKKQLNTNDGKLPSKEFNDILHKESTLFFCIDTAFFSSFYHLKARNLTAEELAAIVIHECGHIFSAAEKINMFHNQLQDLTAPIEINIKSNKDAKEAVNKVRKIISNVKSEDANNISEKKNITLFERVLNTVDLALEDDGVKKHGIVFYTILGMTLSFMIFLCCIRLSYLIVIGLFANISIFIKTGTFKTPEEKDGDFKNNIYNIVNLEYDSDKFTTMHGLGLPLITGLDKIYLNSLLIGGGSSPKKAKSNILVYKSLMLNIYLSSILNCNFISTYGDFQQRNASIGNTILDILRSSKLPLAIEEEVIVQYEKYKELTSVLETRMNKTYNSNEKFSKLFNKLLTLNDLLHFLINGKADRDYDEIMQAARHLKNSELVYQYKRLEQSV